MLKRLAALCAVILALIAGNGIASAQSVDEIIKKGELVVGIDLTNAPWGFLDAQQEHRAAGHERVAPIVVGRTLVLAGVIEVRQAADARVQEEHIQCGAYA